MSVSIMEELLMVLQTSISNHIHTIKDFHVLHQGGLSSLHPNMLSNTPLL